MINGIEVKKNHRFLDHHRFTSHQIKGLIDGFEKDGIDTVVTTEKDMFRLKQFLGDFKAPGIRLLVARMKLKISENEREFFDRLSKVLT